MHGITGGKRVYGPGSFGPLVPVAEPGSITRDQCRSRFQHEPGPIGLHVDALQGRSPWVRIVDLKVFFSIQGLGFYLVCIVFNLMVLYIYNNNEGTTLSLLIIRLEDMMVKKPW
jgi:hypothetical protein